MKQIAPFHFQRTALEAPGNHRRTDAVWLRDAAGKIAGLPAYIVIGKSKRPISTKRVLDLYRDAMLAWPASPVLHRKLLKTVWLAERTGYVGLPAGLVGYLRTAAKSLPRPASDKGEAA